MQHNNSKGWSLDGIKPFIHSVWLHHGVTCLFPTCSLISTLIAQILCMCGAWIKNSLKLRFPKFYKITTVRIVFNKIQSKI